MLPKTNATVLPGKVLSQFRLSDYQLAEDYFAQQHLSTVARAADGKPLAVAREMIASANRLIADGQFAYGMPGFDRAAQRPTNLPFLLWIALNQRNPMTQDEAAALITDENEQAVALAVLEMMKYVLPNAGTAPAGSNPPTPSPSPSTGPDSSAASEPAASDTAKPAP